MTRASRRPLRRPNMRRAVILFPSGLTLGNLFFGVFAIIAASRLEFSAASVYVMLGGICDALDGRVARATNAGTQFGEELDSLVDAITFGLAPAMIMYFAVLNREGWNWLPVFFFAACAVLRLARFNIEQAGTAKTYFQGLPSPAAGITLASYYWFSQSWLYTYGAVGNLPWHRLLPILMGVLSFLMISNVPYPAFPRTGFRSLRAIGASLLVIGAVLLLLTGKLEYFFPIALIYITWGLLRWVLSGLFERRQPTLPYDLSEGEDDDDEDDDEEDFDLTSQVHADRQGYREPAATMSGRLDRPPSADRSERGRSQRDRSERVERPPRVERTGSERVAHSGRGASVDAVGKSAEDERTPRRDRKDRPKRAERERPPRPDRGEREKRPEVMSDPVTPAASGVDAITLTPSLESIPTELPVDATPVSPSPASILGSGEALPARKRKRRRRRGERKERGPTSDRSGELELEGLAEQESPEDEAFEEAPPSRDDADVAPREDSSPYAPVVSVAAPAAPEAPTPLPPSTGDGADAPDVAAPERSPSEREE